MIIHMPDPFPGRCQNYRTHFHNNGEIETLRCLDYEAESHICSFPKPKTIALDVGSWNSSVVEDPQPWVRP